MEAQNLPFVIPIWRYNAYAFQEIRMRASIMHMMSGLSILLSIGRPFTRKSHAWSHAGGPIALWLWSTDLP